ncbi:unnamed protein product, partial [Effrenium voratum]
MDMKAAALLLLFVQVAGKLGDTVRKASEPESADSDSHVVVQLQRVEGAKGSHFYVGNLKVGDPGQDFQMLFDTASGHVMVPHAACKSPACLKHRRFVPWHSSTAVDVNANGSAVAQHQRLVKGKALRDAVAVEFTQADLGEGVANAVLVRDEVCLGTEVSGKVCAQVDLMTAIKLEAELFNDMPYDGMLGLSMAGLSSGAHSVFFAQLMRSNRRLVPQFGLSLGAQSGELYLGGHDAKRLADPLTWFPVLHPEDGFWEVSVRGVRLGNLTLETCAKGCRGIVDTGASRLGVQAQNFQALHSALAKASPLVGGGCEGPDLEFDLGGFSLQLPVADYASGVSCEPQLGELQLDEKEFQ